jgi:general secretion pathway protein I
MRRGFTLLEVMIALAILAVSLTILIGTQANSVHMTERASRMSSAAMLARSQMIDIEHELLTDGFSDMTEEMRGDFRDDGFDGMEWNAVVEVVELPPEASEQLVNSVTSSLFGSSDGQSEGALTGVAGVGMALPMIVGQIPTMINEMSERMRRVTLEISWPEGEGRGTLTVQQYVVNLNKGGAEGVAKPTVGGLPMAPVAP